MQEENKEANDTEDTMMNYGNRDGNLEETIDAQASNSGSVSEAVSEIIVDYEETPSSLSSSTPEDVNEAVESGAPNFSHYITNSESTIPNLNRESSDDELAEVSESGEGFEKESTENSDVTNAEEFLKTPSVDSKDEDNHLENDSLQQEDEGSQDHAAEVDKTTPSEPEIADTEIAAGMTSLDEQAPIDSQPDAVLEEAKDETSEEEESTFMPIDKNAMAEKEETTPPKSRKKLFIILFACIGLIAVIASVTGYGLYYRDRALPGTTVAGQSVSGMKKAAVEKLIQKRIDDTKVTITGVVQSDANLKDLGVTADAKATANDIFDRNKHFGEYVKAIFKNKVYPIETETNYNQLYGFTAGLLVGPAADAEEKEDGKATGEGDSNAPESQAETIAKLKEASSHVSEDVKAQFVDAKFPAIVPNDDYSAFKVSDPVEGNGINPNNLLETALKSLNSKDQGTFEAKIEKFLPARSKADLEPFLGKADELLKHHVEITYKDDKISPEPSERAQWVKMPNPADSKLTDPSIDSNAVLVWVKSVADKYYVAPVNGQRNVDPSGKVTYVSNNSHDGLEIANVEDVAKGVADKISHDEDYTGTFEDKTVPAVWEEKHVVANPDRFPYQPGVDEKWIDVNLTTLEVRAYVGDKVAIGPIPALVGYPVTPTVQGTFKVWLKVADQRMTGFNVDGSRFNLPHVPWILYFHGDYALHGAWWYHRFGNAAFGGTHGCVNLPIPSAKELFEWAPVGTVVVTHK